MRVFNVKGKTVLKAALVIAGWTLFGLFFASQSYLSQVYLGRAVSWNQSLLSWMPCAYTWALLTPAILFMAHRFPGNRAGRWRTLAIHFGAAIFFVLISLVIYVLLRKLLMWNDPFAGSPVQAFQIVVAGQFYPGMLIYGSMIGMNYALNYYRKYQDRELKAAQLESQLAQAQLDALRKQLHPHFLFNTLNTVSILIDEDTKAAREMLVRLSDLLRATLDKSKPHEIPLKQELDFIESYLEIEKMRYQDRLTVKMRVDPVTLNACVPDLILQPIVENAIRHGIAPRTAAGLIEIRAERDNGSLRLQVRDNGNGLQTGWRQIGRAGVGIANTEARLKQMYGADHRFEIQNLAEGGVAVNITIPFYTQTFATTKLEGGNAE